MTDTQFLKQYYQWLLTHYEKVVLIPQLHNKTFLNDFITDFHKMVYFLEMPCVSSDLGRCASHYKLGTHTSLDGFPAIPKELMPKREIHFETEVPPNSACQNNDFGLINRPITLKWILNQSNGPLTFKIPERRMYSDYVFNIFEQLYNLMQPSAEDIPSEVKIEGYNPRDIARSFVQNYPERTWPILERFKFPNKGMNYFSFYDEGQAIQVKYQLHNSARGL